MDTKNKSVKDIVKDLEAKQGIVGVEAAKTFEQFDKHYRLVREFGIKALRTALEVERKRQGLGTAVTVESVVDAVLGQALTKIDGYMDKQVKDLSMDNIRKAISSEHTPRADNRPEITNKNILQQDVSAQMQRQLQMPPWARKMDLAADPKINDAIRNIVNDPKGPITTQLNNMMDRLDNELRNQLKLKMAARLTPTRKVRPEGL